MENMGSPEPTGMNRENAENPYSLEEVTPVDALPSMDGTGEEDDGEDEVDQDTSPGGGAPGGGGSDSPPTPPPK